MTRVVDGDARGFSRIGKRREVAEACEEDGGIHHVMAEFFRGVREIGVGEDEVILCIPEPQSAAFVRIASTSPGNAARFFRASFCAEPMSPTCHASAPQHACAGGMTTSMPLRASTAMVAVLISPGRVRGRSGTWRAESAMHARLDGARHGRSKRAVGFGLIVKQDAGTSAIF